MIYCFRSFHTEKNVISVSHEKNGNFSFALARFSSSRAFPRS
jgi:hypothetical protein